MMSPRESKWFRGPPLAKAGDGGSCRGALTAEWKTRGPWREAQGFGRAELPTAPLVAGRGVGGGGLGA